jgi:hypothetical protein
MHADGSYIHLVHTHITCIHTHIYECIYTHTYYIYIYIHTYMQLRKLGEDVVARTDFFNIEPDACGWLMKESSGGLMGRRWQKRWFLVHALRQDTNYDGSVHKVWYIYACVYMSVCVCICIHMYDEREVVCGACAAT